MIEYHKINLYDIKVFPSSDDNSETVEFVAEVYLQKVLKNRFKDETRDGAICKAKDWGSKPPF